MICTQMFTANEADQCLPGTEQGNILLGRDTSELFGVMKLFNVVGIIYIYPNTLSKFIKLYT